MQTKKSMIYFIFQKKFAVLTKLQNFYFAKFEKLHLLFLRNVVKCFCLWVWRNWQTRKFQVLVKEISCEFKSHHSHHFLFCNFCCAHLTSRLKRCRVGFQLMLFAWTNANLWAIGSNLVTIGSNLRAYQLLEVNCDGVTRHAFDSRQTKILIH